MRVAAAFALAMAIVLAGAGALVYVGVGEDLSHQLDQDLQLRAQDVSGLVAAGGSLSTPSGAVLIERGESFAQLLDPQGRVLDATGPLGTRPLLSHGQLAGAQRSDRFFDRPSAPELDEPARLLAVSVRRSGRPLVLVVGATRENRAETLRSLRTELLIAGPVALVLAIALGYLLAGTGLRAVEAMRRRAAEISAQTPGERLPVPPTRDELQQLAETLNAMLDRLERALEREREFVAEASHELRTPLALLRAELDYALHYADSEEELRRAVRSASEETDRLVQLASDLLLTAVADNGRLALRLEPIKARELLESVRKRFAWRAEASGRRLAVEAPDELIVVADRLRLEQALGNLVENALRHGAGAVTLAACRISGSIEFHVRDEGPGLPADLLPRAFQRFSRAEGNRGRQGTGLGMPIVATIAHAHHGEASVSNGVRGADVAIRLPIAATPTPASARPTSPLPSTHPESSDPAGTH